MRRFSGINLTNFRENTNYFIGDLRKIFMQELYSFRPVSEGEIDSLLNEVERITELYLKASAR